MALPLSAPEDQDVYSLTLLNTVRSIGAQYGFGAQLHSAPDGAGTA